MKKCRGNGDVAFYFSAIPLYCGVPLLDSSEVVAVTKIVCHVCDTQVNLRLTITLTNTKNTEKQTTDARAE